MPDRTIHNKLVRDKIVNMILDQGETVEYRILTDLEYIEALGVKLREEVEEFLESGLPEELADILEVVYAFGEILGLHARQIEAIRDEKVTDRGGFKRRIYLCSTS